MRYKTEKGTLQTPGERHTKVDGKGQDVNKI